MKTEKKIRAVITGVTITKPFDVDTKNVNLDLSMTAIGGVDQHLAMWMREMTFPSLGEDGLAAPPTVLEVTFLHRTNDGVIAGPAKKVTMTMKIGGESK